MFHWNEMINWWLRCFSTKWYWSFLNSFLAFEDFNRLLITFANSLDPDQDGQNDSFDMDGNDLTL